jgi:hypothetical protein
MVVSVIPLQMFAESLNENLFLDEYFDEGIIERAISHNIMSASSTIRANTDWYTANPSLSTFYIGTADELAGLAELANGNSFWHKTIRLNANIDLSGMNWVPIENFSGNFDGQGYVIENLTISGDIQNSMPVGLFGRIVYPSSINNIGLENMNIDVNFVSSSSGVYVGGLCGLMDGTIYNSYVEGSVSVSVFPDYNYNYGINVGGLCGAITLGSSYFNNRVSNS